MTLIECFDRIPVENIASCLQLKPDKVIFLGNKEQMEVPVQRYKDFFAQRKLSAKVSMQDVPANDLEKISDTLRKILKSGDDCVIDVTGGDESMLLAVGAVLAGLDKVDRRRVSVRKFDVHTGLVEDFDGNAPEKADPCVALRVSELVALHGGTIHPKLEQPPHSCTPDRIRPLWDIVSKDPKQWNTVISYLHEFESRSESKTHIDLSLDDISNIPDFSKKEPLVRELLDKLDDCGVIRNRSNFRCLRYQYVDPILHECVKKAGNILEFKTLLQARSMRRNGKPYFTDCQMSVSLDWDGEINKTPFFKAETRNEIDVILTRGLVPLFISCKNGHIDDEELFKLHTVARRFGSRYARVMLIATELDQKGPKADEAFEKRAKDMGICLVTNAAKLSDAGWEAELEKAMEGK